MPDRPLPERGSKDERTERDGAHLPERTRRWLLQATGAAAATAVTIFAARRSEAQAPTTCNPTNCGPATCGPVDCPPVTGCNPNCNPSA